MLKYIAEVCVMEEIRLGDGSGCGKRIPAGSDEWTVIRIGADIKIKCLGCGRIVMMERADFVKRRKKVLEAGTRAGSGHASRHGRSIPKEVFYPWRSRKNR